MLLGTRSHNQATEGGTFEGDMTWCTAHKGLMKCYMTWCTAHKGLMKCYMTWRTVHKGLMKCYMTWCNAHKVLMKCYMTWCTAHNGLMKCYMTWRTVHKGLMKCYIVPRYWPQYQKRTLTGPEKDFPSLHKDLCWTIWKTIFYATYWLSKLKRKWWINSIR